MSYICTFNPYYFPFKMTLRKYKEGDGLVILLLPARVLNKRTPRVVQIKQIISSKFVLYLSELIIFM